MVDRTLLISRYLSLQTTAAKLGIRGTAHVTRDMSDAEIVRLGVALTAQVERAKVASGRSRKVTANAKAS